MEAIERRMDKMLVARKMKALLLFILTTKRAPIKVQRNSSINQSAGVMSSIISEIIGARKRLLLEAAGRNGHWKGPLLFGL